MRNGGIGGFGGLPVREIAHQPVRFLGDAVFITRRVTQFAHRNILHDVSSVFHQSLAARSGFVLSGGRRQRDGDRHDRQQ